MYCAVYGRIMAVYLYRYLLDTGNKRYLGHSCPQL